VILYAYHQWEVLNSVYSLLIIETDLTQFEITQNPSGAVNTLRGSDIRNMKMLKYFNRIILFKRCIKFRNY